MKIVDTYKVEIYCGSRVGYTNEYISLDYLKQVCREYCDDTSYCVSITETHFVYKGGEEPGLHITMINYPRFPLSQETINDHGITLARILMDKARQKRVSVICGRMTVMLESDDE